MNRPDPDLTVADRSVADLAARCREESARGPERRDPRYCLELFRRALVAQDPAAWTAVYAQYHALVRYWLGRVADPEDLIQETFTRFNRAATAERLAQGHFPTLGNLLAFLRRIAINLRINQARQDERKRRAEQAWSEIHTGTASEDWEQVERRQLADYILGLLQDEERLVLRLTYEFDLPPREIAKRYPQHFQDVDEVNRIKERIKKRLRNDPRVRRYLSER
jgi:RNA polymerase sigma factor (sigma-70 family)